MAKKYLCMKKWKDLTFVVNYTLGAYYVSIMATKDTGFMLVPLNDRKYKTLSGASNFLARTKATNGDNSEPEEVYHTEDFIRQGLHLKGEQ